MQGINNSITHNNMQNDLNNHPVMPQKSISEIKKEFSNNNNGLKKNIKLKRFKYKVKDNTGKIISSYFDADAKVDVESFLLNKGYEIISIEEET